MTLKLVVNRPDVATGQSKGNAPSVGALCEPRKYHPEFNGWYGVPYVMFLDNLTQAQLALESEDWGTAFIRDSEERGDFEEKLRWDASMHVDAASLCRGQELRQRIELAEALFVRVDSRGSDASRLATFSDMFAALGKRSARIGVHLDPNNRLETLQLFLRKPRLGEKRVTIYQDCARLNVALHRFLSEVTARQFAKVSPQA
jgi:hypothetical protein